MAINSMINGQQALLATFLSAWPTCLITSVSLSQIHTNVNSARSWLALSVFNGVSSYRAQ